MGATCEAAPMAAALACGQPGCLCASPPRRGSWRVHCPAHPDEHPDFDLTTGDNGTPVFICRAGCSQDVVIKALILRGLWEHPAHETKPSAYTESPQPKGRPERPSKAARRQLTKSVRQADAIRDAGGSVVAVHMRVDHPPDAEHLEGWVQRWWERPDGRVGLDDVPAASLPLFGSELLGDLPDGETVAIVEGEPATKALLRLGIPAVGTVTGAAVVPSDDVLGVLSRFRVPVWPDSDSDPRKGRRHMLNIAEALQRLGARVTGEVRWEKYEGGDAADILLDHTRNGDLDHDGARETALRLISDAEPLEQSDEAGGFSEGDGHGGGDHHGDGVDLCSPPAQANRQADQLVRLARETYRFGTALGGEPFAVRLSGPNVALALRGGGSLRAALASAYAKDLGRVPSSSALTNALLVLEGDALQAARELVSVRIARHGDGIVIDLGDETGRAIVVAPAGWHTVDRSPVLFRRTELIAALPVPSASGSLEELRALLNVSETSWPLLLGELMAALIPDIPHPPLLLRGEQGSGKSMAARILASTVDPSPAPLRSPPADLRNWQVAASGSWVVAVDNLTAIADWFSDAICRAATGEGLVMRRLYSDDGVSVLAFRRVVILTAIDAGALRGDLGDRLLSVELGTISPNRRRLDDDVWVAFLKTHSSVLGALLDLHVAVLAELPNIHLDELPRMADFARVLAALDRVIGTHALATYLGQTATIADEVIDGDAVATAVREFASARGRWEGSASELLTELTPEHPSRRWPQSPHALARRLRLVVPALRQVGVTVDFSRDASRRRVFIQSSNRKEDE